MTTRRLVLIAATAVLLVARGPLFGELFRGSRELGEGLRASGLAIADLNGDGRLDVVLTINATDGAGRVRVLLNSGDESVLGPGSDYAVGVGPVFVTVGDLDARLGPDLFVVNSGSSTVSLLLNRGDGRFADAAHFAVGLGPRVGQLADLDDDGDLDAVTSNLASFDVNVLVGSGGGSFAKDERLVVGDNPHFVVVDDFDGDGTPDVAVAHRDDRLRTGAVSCFKGKGDASFEAPMVTDLRGEDVVPRILAKGDYDDDGQLDLAVLNGDRSLILLRNSGAGAFEVSRVTDDAGGSAGLFTGFLIARDFGGDDRLDVIAPLSRLGNHGFRVHHAIATEEASATDVWLEYEIGHLGIGDLTGDGIDDALVAWGDRPGLAIAVGIAPGVVESRMVVPVEEGPRVLRVGDVDGDGDADVVAMSSNRFERLLSSASGEFELAPSIELPGRSLQDFVAGRFSESPEPGIELIATDLAAGALVLLDSRGDDGEEIGTIPVAALPSRVVSGDTDGDGRVDLVVSHQVGTAVTLVFDAWGAAPSVSSVDVGSAQTAVALGDLDADSDADIVVATRVGLAVLLGDGAGGFAPAGIAGDLSTFANARSLRIARVAGGASVDLVLAQGSTVTVIVDPIDAVDVFDATERIERVFGEEVQPLAIEDLDADGRLDILTATPGRVQVMLGREGGLSAPVDFVVGSSPRSLVTADFDGDGLVDCASADFNAKAVSVLFGTGETPIEDFRRGDVDVAGGVQINDAVALLDYLFRGGAAPPCRDSADVDDNGAVDLTDAISILNYLFRAFEPPPAPGPEVCGPDPTPDALVCARSCSEN